MSPQTHVRLDPLSGAFLGNMAFAGVINEDEVLTELEVVGVGSDRHMFDLLTMILMIRTEMGCRSREL